MSLTIPFSFRELLHVFQCLPWLLVVYPSTMKLLHVSHFVLWLLAVSNCLSLSLRSHRVAT